MQAALPVTTTCTDPQVDRDISFLLRTLMDSGLTPRKATEQAALKVAAAAEAKQWNPELVRFVVIRTVDLGARYSRLYD